MSLFGKLLGKKKEDSFDPSADFGLGDGTPSGPPPMNDPNDPFAQPAPQGYTDPLATQDPLQSPLQDPLAPSQSAPITDNYQHNGGMPPLGDPASQSMPSFPPPEQNDSVGRNLAHQFVQQQQAQSQPQVQQQAPPRQETSLEVVGLKVDALKAEIEALKAHIKHLEQLVENQKRGW